jgi:hypothetical protein
MTGRLRANIPEQEQNNLVMRISEGGFIVPTPNKISGLMVGHIDVPDPKPDHPTTYGATVATRRWSLDCPLPVGYVGYGYIDLVNTDKPALQEYHKKLRDLVLGEE